ncbi:ABC transporter substrate-binding protein [Elioraea sp.]|uniref:ABC transporter substrate-binding protein n=1 Tax=Elioraea sp. TaxID=2185103 RepID=UPI0025C2C3EB|nr:ABC transporter substrate-binding protein [Elioraea sp.]
MIPRRTMLGGSLTATALTRPAHARPVPLRIGWLTMQRPASLAPFIPALRAGLAERNLVEGRDLILDFRFGNDDRARVPALLDELMRVPVRLLLVQGAAAAPVIRARPPVPVVFVMSSDPVAAGLADSLSRPPAGVTGITFLSAALNGKRVELLHELRPGLQRLAVLSNPGHPGEALERAEAEAAARRHGMAARFHHVQNEAELDAAFAVMAADDAEGMVVFADGFALQNRTAIAAFATARRIPLISGWRAFAEAGALVSYGPRLEDAYRRLAHFVARILRGARPEDMPIEQPRVFELVVNQRSAEVIGIEISTALLARADLVLE